MRSAWVPAVGLMMLVLLGTLGVARTGVGAASPGPATTAAFTPAPCPVAAPLPDLVEGEGYVCGLVTVPQRHGDPAGTQLQLAAMRIVSQSEVRQSDPIVFAADGPGESGLDLASAATHLTSSFPDRDLILFDQRGARNSVPFLRCEEHDPVALSALTGQIDSADALTADAAAYAACAARFAGAGYDLAAFNTLESAADVRDVATALGYTDYDFHGTGYGTRIGQTLVRDLPTGLRSVVLDSVEPTSLNTGPLRASTFQDAFQALVSACSEAETCSAEHPDLEQTLLDTAIRLTTEPVRVPVTLGGATLDVVVTGNGFVDAVAAQFQGDANDIDAIPAFIARAAGDDLTAVAAAMVASRTDTTRADGLHYAVRCTEDQPGATEYALEGLPEQLHFLAGIEGDRNSLVEICAAMGIADLGGVVRDAATSDIPVLTVSGEFDPFTPATFADKVRSTLAQAYRPGVPGRRPRGAAVRRMPRGCGRGIHRGPEPGAGRLLHRGHARVRQHRGRPQRRSIDRARCQPRAGCHAHTRHDPETGQGTQGQAGQGRSGQGGRGLRECQRHHQRR